MTGQLREQSVICPDCKPGAVRSTDAVFSVLVHLRQGIRWRRQILRGAPLSTFHLPPSTFERSAMKRALSLVDGHDWDAGDFAAKDDDWKNARRRCLTCLACGERATFRAASLKRPPTFAATHKVHCALVAVSWSAFRYLM